MESIRKIRSNFKSCRDLLLFIQICLLITILPILIKMLTIPKLMNVLTSREPGDCGKMNREETIDRIVKFTDYILGRNFWMYKSTCLKRSLVLYHFLRKAGINVHVCFGVRRNKELPQRDEAWDLEGHAWLLYKGDIYLEKNLDFTRTYKMTYCFPEIREKGTGNSI